MKLESRPRAGRLRVMSQLPKTGNVLCGPNPDREEKSNAQASGWKPDSASFGDRFPTILDRFPTILWWATLKHPVSRNTGVRWGPRINRAAIRRHSV